MDLSAGGSGPRVGRKAVEGDEEPSWRTSHSHGQAHERLGFQWSAGRGVVSAFALPVWMQLVPHDCTAGPGVRIG